VETFLAIFEGTIGLTAPTYIGQLRWASERKGKGGGGNFSGLNCLEDFMVGISIGDGGVLHLEEGREFC